MPVPCRCPAYVVWRPVAALQTPQCQRPELVLLAVLVMRFAVEAPLLGPDSEAARLISLPPEASAPCGSSEAFRTQASPVTGRFQVFLDDCLPGGVRHLNKEPLSPRLSFSRADCSSLCLQTMALWPGSHVVQERHTLQSILPCAAVSTLPFEALLGALRPLAAALLLAEAP